MVVVVSGAGSYAGLALSGHAQPWSLVKWSVVSRLMNLERGLRKAIGIVLAWPSVRVWQLLLVAVVVAVAVFSQWQAERPLNERYSEREIAYFKEVAFEDEYDMFHRGELLLEGGGSSGDRVAKWEKDIRLWVMGVFTDDDLAQIDRVVAELSKLLGPVSMTRVDDESEANVLVLFAPSSASLGYVGLVGIGRPRTGREEANPWAIDRARIGLYSDDPANRRETSIRVGITLILGLEFRSVGFFRSAILDDPPSWDDPPTWDELIALEEASIRILYEEKIEAGMTLEDLKRLGL